MDIGYDNLQSKPKSLKFKINEKEIRRITLNSPSEISYGYLCSTLRSLYSLPSDTKMTFTWIDDEGDKISISSDIEVIDAINVMETMSLGGSLKFDVKFDKPTLENSILKADSNSQISCCFCQEIIREGVRYQLVSEKYHYYCPNCEDKHQISRYSLSIKLYKSEHHNLVEKYIRGIAIDSMSVSTQLYSREKLWKSVPKRNNSDSPNWRKSSPPSSTTTNSWSEISSNSSRSSKPMCRFIRDVSFSDGEKVPPLSEFSKIWRVKNDGQRAWPGGCILAPAGGDYLQVGDNTKLPEIDAGDEVDISVTLLSPPVVGRYVCYYRPQTSEGRWFGQRLWADIRVYQPDDHEVLDQVKWQADFSYPVPETTPAEVENPPWTKELDILASMGFTDKDQCIEKLEKHAIQKGFLTQNRRTPEEILQLTVMELLKR